MRVNVYSQEMTRETMVVEKQVHLPGQAGPGRTYYGVRMFLRSAPELHDTPEDDDRSAVTLWFESLDEAQSYFDDVVAHAIDIAKGRRIHRPAGGSRVA
ncbi:MAG: hypothetical protein AUG85_05370 [Gemmatimonadetes bacterium 13_1_20CM_4_66_11]|nr:MAG: hypothetical protein AUI86_11850 [Gemmatimonadetes bacterium 13_1_40CM_3_66_12]OLD88149.1 MAG: hypothetical protein AUG85_05370 [Gemmatimonadetes bacterium 13_1_20CM_4_66_11]